MNEEAQAGVLDPITIDYIFKFNNGEEKVFSVKLNRKNLLLILPPRKSIPQWASLQEFRCPNCKLDETRFLYCPVAVNMMELVDYFKDGDSCSVVELVIETKERKYQKVTSLQAGLSSLIGIYMVTSGCPILDKLKPMVRYHLPFACFEETTYRLLSMYLTAQYFLKQNGKNPDWETKKIGKIFGEIFQVNRNVCVRLRNVISDDAILSALIKLNANIEFMSFQLDTKTLKDIEHYFNAYILMADLEE